MLYLERTTRRQAKLAERSAILVLVSSVQFFLENSFFPGVCLAFGLVCL